MIDLRLAHLRALVAVADQGHFGRAAASLGIVQSAVSGQLRRLEESVGAPLVHRTSRAVALTPAGEVLLPIARRAVAEVEQAALDARAAAEGRAGAVTLGAQTAARTLLAPQAIARLKREHPEIEVRLRPGTSAELLTAVAEGRVDLALVRDASARSGVSVERLWSEPVMAALPVGHRLARRDAVTLQDLNDESFIAWPRAGAPEFHDRLVAACAAVGLTRRVAFEVAGVETRLGLVAAGLGVGLEPATHAVLERAGVTFRPLTGHPIDAVIDLVMPAVAAAPAALTLAGALRQIAADRAVGC